MYVHLGNDVVVPVKNIVGIFDIENTTTGRTTGHLLEKATKEGRVVNITFEMPKSFVVCMEKGQEIIYISQISAVTLKKRLGKL
jgi:hypothetical protein